MNKIMEIIDRVFQAIMVAAMLVVVVSLVRALNRIPSDDCKAQNPFKDEVFVQGGDGS